MITIIDRLFELHILLSKQFAFNASDAKFIERVSELVDNGGTLTQDQEARVLEIWNEHLF